MAVGFCSQLARNPVLECLILGVLILSDFFSKIIKIRGICDMDNHTSDHLHAEDRDRLSLADLLEEIPWPDVWCSEAFVDRMAQRQEKHLTKENKF
jgi:hypothetical protein